MGRAWGEVAVACLWGVSWGAPGGCHCEAVSARVPVCACIVTQPLQALHAGGSCCLPCLCSGHISAQINSGSCSPPMLSITPQALPLFANHPSLLFRISHLQVSGQGQHHWLRGHRAGRLLCCPVRPAGCLGGPYHPHPRLQPLLHGGACSACLPARLPARLPFHVCLSVCLPACPCLSGSHACKCLPARPALPALKRLSCLDRMAASAYLACLPACLVARLVHCLCTPVASGSCRHTYSPCAAPKRAPTCALWHSRCRPWAP